MERLIQAISATKVMKHTGMADPDLGGHSFQGDSTRALAVKTALGGRENLCAGIPQGFDDDEPCSLLCAASSDYWLHLCK